MIKKYYTIYDVKTDDVVASGTLEECAKQMNRSRDSLRCSIQRCLSGKYKKFAVVVKYINDADK